MKHTTLRKLAGIAAIVTLASCTMLPMGMTAYATTQTYSITITNPSANHTYEAYQILKGDLTVEDDSLILTEIAWGANVSADGQSTLGDASDYAGTLTDDNVAAAAKTLGGYLTGDPAGSVSSTTGGDYVIDGLEPGYYLVKDKDASLTGTNDAYTAFILEVVGDADAVVKSALPEVDKQVLDEVADAESGAEQGWGETADHAINESFQFRLEATLPNDSDLDSYSTYMVKFNDTLSAGVVFEGIDSVTVNGTTVTDYDTDAAAGLTDGSFYLTIEDIVPIVGAGNLENAVIEVLYSAHLDENAGIGNVDTNNNTVNLEYSNNPNWVSEGDGDTPELGQTPDDTVWVFTYEMPNQKVDQDNVPLDGAGFRLYDSTGAEVALIKDGDTYRPVADGEDGEELISAVTTGDFSIVGLDAGTYTLKETTIPAGYNKCADVTVVISADHAENDTSAATTIAMTVDGEDATQVVIQNEKGSSLPSTGGIGTTLFYVVGGTMAVGAGVYLIAKKRMNNNEE